MNDVSTLQQTSDVARRKFISATYGWMVLALSISAICAFLVANSIKMQAFIFGNVFFFF